MKKTIILFLALLAGFASVKGQDDEIKLPTVIPPSPEVAALLKFVDIPISQYTGATQMPIAMGTLAKGSIQVPISINYHSSGIRVDEVASRVGLGWALSAGGVVSRTVMGKADEGDLGYFSSDIDEFFLSNGNPNEDFECIESDSDPVAIARFEKLKRLATGQSDAEPDLFNYSLPNGKSGKFLFDRNRVIHKFEENDIKIENPFSNSLQSPTSWKIIDSDGTVYLFDKIEHSYSSSFCDDGGASGGGKRLVRACCNFLAFDTNHFC